MRILGIDFGEKRIGLAMTDDKGMMAFPHSVVENNKDTLEHIVNLAKKEGVEKVIIGDSVNYAGEKNLIMKKVDVFVDELISKGFTVVLEPEILSSHQASHFQGKHDKIDASAASIILQSYIDRESFKI